MDIEEIDMAILFLSSTGVPDMGVDNFSAGALIIDGKRTAR